MTRHIRLPLETTTAPERAPLVIRHVTRSQARRFVADHHSHHDPHVGEIFAFGAFVGHSLVGVEVIGRPVAPALDDSETWEITRQTIGPGAPRFASSRLHGAAGRMARVFGVGLITYTRIDEPGRSLLAANFHPEAIAIGRAHDTGNRAARWLPGLYEPSTEIVDRVRWRLGESRGPLEWDGHRWRSTIRSTSPIRDSDCRAAEVKDEEV